VATVVDVWVTTNDGATPATRYCSTDELERASRFGDPERASRFGDPEGASRWLAGRGLLHQILGQALGREPAAPERTRSAPSPRWRRPSLSGVTTPDGGQTARADRIDPPSHSRQAE
jgi:hypothetical protein